MRDWENEDVVLEEVVAAPDNNQKKLDFDDTVEEDVTAEKGETETHGEKEQVTWTARTLRSKSRKVRMYVLAYVLYARPCAPEHMNVLL